MGIFWSKDDNLTPTEIMTLCDRFENFTKIKQIFLHLSTYNNNQISFRINIGENIMQIKADLSEYMYKIIPDNSSYCNIIINSNYRFSFNDISLINLNYPFNRNCYYVNWRLILENNDYKIDLFRYLWFICLLNYNLKIGRTTFVDNQKYKLIIDYS